MTVHVNVFTAGLGYSHWQFDLGLTVEPKYVIKKKLHEEMNSWFKEGKNIYVRTPGSQKTGSWIVCIYFSDRV